MSSTRRLDPTSVRAYMSRDWGLFERANDRHWAIQKKRGGLAEALRVTSLLRDHARAMQAEWPTDADREEDLETHRRVAALLAKVEGRAARGRKRRSRRPRRVR